VRLIERKRRNVAATTTVLRGRGMSSNASRINGKGGGEAGHKQVKEETGSTPSQMFAQIAQ